MVTKARLWRHAETEKQTSRCVFENVIICGTARPEPYRTRIACPVDIISRRTTAVQQCYNIIYVRGVRWSNHMTHTTVIILSFELCMFFFFFLRFNRAVGSFIYYCVNALVVCSKLDNNYSNPAIPLSGRGAARRNQTHCSSNNIIIYFLVRKGPCRWNKFYVSVHIITVIRTWCVPRRHTRRDISSK